MSDMVYLFAAYAVIWIGLFVYFIQLHTRLNALSRQVEELAETQHRGGES